VAQDFQESQSEAFQFCAGETAGGAAWTNSSPEEAFVGIYVADPGKELLIEQSGLDGQLALAEEKGEAVAADGERFGARTAEGFIALEIAKLETAEPARIDEAKFATAGESESSVGVGFDRSVGAGDEQASGHAEVDDPLSVGGRIGGSFPRGMERAQLTNDVLAGAVHGEEGATF
jgi:hypothetical protein